MTLGVDSAFPSSLSPMEAKGCSRRWRTRIPEFNRGGTGPTSVQISKSTETDRDRDPGGGVGDRERRGPRKSVTMAPTSRYMTDGRQYTMRKPLFTTEQQTSILKKSYGEEHPEKEKQWAGGATETRHPHRHRTETDFRTSKAEEEIPDALDRSQADILRFSSASRSDLSPSPGVGDGGPWPSLEEPVFGSARLDDGSARRSLSSPPLEIHQLASSPLSPRWSSALLSPPSYAPPPRPSRPRQTELRLGGGGGKGKTHINVAASFGYSRVHSPPSVHTTSPHQANYWACAIPRSMPPSPDRRSPAWDPDKEYQALLDYTYPLRPGRAVSGWGTSEPGGGSLLRTDPALQDSGIELDRLCSSTSVSALDFSFSGALVSGTRRVREKTAVPGIGQRSPETRGLSHSKSSDGVLSCSPYSSADPIGLSLESLDCAKDRSGQNHSARGGGGGHHRRPQEVFAACGAFIRSTSVLPRPGRLGVGEWDEEFRPLPKRLEEFQVLSRQVREVTAQLCQPVTASWESLERGTNSVHSSTTLLEKREAEGEEEEEEERKEEEREKEKEDVYGSEEPWRIGKEDQGEDSLQAAHGPGPRAEPPGRGMTRASLREVEAMVEQLVGLSLPEFQSRSQGEQEQAESLMQHIQTFCSNLEELIQWLYTVVAKMEVLAPPTVDIESVKSSLADYKSFQREVSARQPLTTSVLQTGEVLLNCMSSTSPVLKDTLSLIERQSRALETHTEHLFSSILAAMDSLTQPSQPAHPPQPEGEEAGAGGLGSVEVQGSAM